MQRLIFILFVSLFATNCAVKKQVPTTANSNPSFTIEELQHRTFNFFWETIDKNYQIPDRYPTKTFSSVAATGFGLSAYLVGVERGYISRNQAAERVLKTLQVLQNLPQGDAATGVSGFKGFFYHFLDHEKALRFKNVELSSIDTALLMAGILSCMTYFDADNTTEQQIRRIADQMYRRVDWQWFTNGNKQGLIRMGWHPESGFIDRYWDGYNEAMLLYILALGSPSHPVSPDAWEAWCHRYPYKNYMGLDMLNFGPLFGHQYSHIWIDFRGIQDNYMMQKGIDYFENSRRATIGNRLYCIANPKGYEGYGDHIWGLTACDGPGYKETTFNGRNVVFEGYAARGAATEEAFDDGTIAPTAAGGAIPFAPKECLASLKTQWETFYPNLVGQYGFKDAFNLSYTFGKGNENGWFDVDYLGIDQGPILLQAENYRSELLWKLMRKNPYIIAGLQRAGFKGGWLQQNTIPVPPMPISTTSNNKKERYKAPNPKELFDKKTFIANNQSINYCWLSPKKINETEKYPLVIFLHGSGERGNDNEAQLRNGVLAFAENTLQGQHPCFVFAPQCPTGQKWSDYDLQNDLFWRDQPTEPMQVMMTAIDDIISKNPTIDKDRIYITGLSMGGLGTFDALLRRPDFFAAAIPVCGGAEPSMMSQIKHIPMWITHGALDGAVPVEYSRNVVSVLQQYQSPIKYTEYSTLNHGIWQETFYNTAILEWLFSQKRR